MINVTSSPDLILLSTAILLTIMSSYTAIDLLTLVKNNEKTNRYLFLGSIGSMSIGVWVANFLVMYSVNPNGYSSYSISIAILSIVLGAAFTGIAFYILLSMYAKALHIAVGSLFMTSAVFCIHILGVYSLHLNIQYNVVPTALALTMVYVAFFLTFELLSSKNFPYSNYDWLKPVCGLIITGGVVAGYFLLTTNATIYYANDLEQRQADYQITQLFYLALFVAILILLGLMFSRAMVNKRLEATDSNLRDISTALDASSIVAITDPRGTITYVNDKFVEISQYSKDEIIGENHRVINSGYHSREFFKNLCKTIGQGKIWKGEIRNRAKDGSIYWVNTTIVPFLDKKGKPYQYVSIRTDITNRKLAEEQLKNTLKDVSDIKFALDQSSIVAFTDQRGTITAVNDKFVEISKYGREELIGKNHRILNSGYHTREFFKEMWKTIGTGNVWQGELRNRAKDGTYYWLDTTIVPFLNENGKPYQYLAIRNDITERKRTEQAIHRQDKLAAVGQLAAGVAHEIRNPLTSMKGYAEFLTMDETDEERREYLDIILDEIERVDSIVEDFMVLAKPKAEQMSVKNIIPVMKNVLSLIDYEARKRKITVHFEYHTEQLTAVIDENRIKQVFLNFVKNALEAMPDGGQIKITISEYNNNQIHIAIQDTGIGIPPDKLKKIGEPFFTTKEKGNGLGLMVSFKIIESHKGEVFIESEINEGTTFNILLPKPEMEL